MKQYLEALERIKPLVSEEENYIFFNDGKAVETHIEEGIDIKVDDPFDFSSYGYVTDKEKEVREKVKLTTLITITKSLTLKIFHICDDTDYIDYQLEVMPRCNVKIINMYLDVVSNAHITLNAIIHHQANVEYYEVNKFVNNIEKNTSFYLSHKTNVNVRNMYLNDKDNTENFNVHLLAENGNIDVLNVALSGNKNKTVQNAFIYHHDLLTNSNFTAYGISKNESSIYFNNNGYIDNGAHKAVMKQKTKGIVIDSTSEVKANPALYINEDDVVANHGCSIGSINEDDLYYLMSRGLTREESELLIVNAFIEPFFKDLKEEKIEQKTKEFIEQIL